MGDFKSVLKVLRKSNNLTQDMLAKKLGLSRSAIGMYEKGSREPDYEILEKIADFFNVDIDYLLGRTLKTTLLPESIKQLSYEDASSSNNPTGVRIPVLGRVAAGIPIEAIEDIIDTEEIPEALAKTGTFFGLKLKGSSMEPRMCEDDVVIVRQQSDAEDGDIVIATVNGDEATCKRLKKYNDGIVLISNNPSYEPMYFSNKEIQEKPVNIIGKVVELRGKF